MFRLSAAIVTNDFLIRGWMRSEPTFEISKLAGIITVNATADTLIVHGPAQSIRPTRAGRQAQFSWSVVMDGVHYWEIQMAADGCTSAEAVDAELGPGRVASFEFRWAGV